MPLPRPYKVGNRVFDKGSIGRINRFVEDDPIYLSAAAGESVSTFVGAKVYNKPITVEEHNAVYDALAPFA